MSVYKYICTHVYVNEYVHVYIYTSNPRNLENHRHTVSSLFSTFFVERSVDKYEQTCNTFTERSVNKMINMYTYIYVYIYIFVLSMSLVHAIKITLQHTVAMSCVLQNCSVL